MNPTCDTDCNVKTLVASPVNMKQSIRRGICHANAGCETQGNGKHTLVCEAGQANVKQKCESLPNVKPVSFSGSAYHGLNQRVCNSLNADQASQKEAQGDSDQTAKVIPSQGVSVDMNVPDFRFKHQPISAAKVVSNPGKEGECPVAVAKNSQVCTKVTLGKGHMSNKDDTKDELRPIFDINFAGVADKFVNSILLVNQLKLSANTDKVDTEIYNAWRRQSDFSFGFVPLDEQLLSDIEHTSNVMGRSPFAIHEIVRSTNKPNFMQARFPVDSQLNVKAWKRHLEGYWDRQFIHLIQFGFPLDYNRSCTFIHEQGNHKLATEFPTDINAYIEDEKTYSAILGPFDKHPIPSGHCSPFMTRAKPNSDRRCVVVDLSWPIGASINAGIDKTSYLGSTFSLNFPTDDDITR